MAVLLVTMYAGTRLNTDISKGISDRFRSLPIWRAAPIAGALLGDIARYLPAGCLVVVLGVAMGYRPAGGALGVVAGIGLLLLFALSLSWAWAALGLVVRSTQAVMTVGTVVLFPLTLASNVFVRPQTMPRLAAGLRQGQPGQPPRDRRARPAAARRPDGRVSR